MDLKSIAEAYQSIKEKKLDPVGKEDGDVNNDGKKDSTDSYLMNRRKAIGKAMKKEAYTVTNADKKGNTPAYQGYKAGKKNVKTGEPMYKAAPHMKEHHQKDKDGNTIPHEDEIKQSVFEQLTQDNEEIDKFDAVIAYLIDETFAKDWDEAQKIMTNFKPEIIEEIYQSQLWTLFDENYRAMRNPEKYKPDDESDKPYRERSKAARMKDPHRGINSPAFKKFMADRGMSV
jgi:hypothetical protein